MARFQGINLAAWAWRMWTSSMASRSRLTYQVMVQARQQQDVGNKTLLPQSITLELGDHKQSDRRRQVERHDQTAGAGQHEAEVAVQQEEQHERTALMQRVGRRRHGYHDE